MFVIVPTYLNGEYTGSIGVQFAITEIDEIMNDGTGLGETGESYLVGEDYLLRSNSRFGNESTILKKKIESESVTLGFQGKSGFHIIENDEGVSVLSYYARTNMKDTYQTDFEWVIVTEITESEAFVLVKTMGNTILVIGIIASLVVAFLAFLIARYFTAPIVKLTNVAKSMALGKLNDLFNISLQDEIGQLGNSFKTMQQSLQQKAEQANEIANGNLTIDVEPLSDQDSMGISFKTMVENLRKQMHEIREGVNVISSSSAEIMASVSQLASSSSE